MPEYHRAASTAAEPLRHDRRRPGPRVAAERRRHRCRRPARAWPPTRCAASACSSSACTRPTSWSPSRSPSPRWVDAARVAEVAAAHHHEPQPVRATCRWPTPPSAGTALLSRLEERSSCARPRRRPAAGRSPRTGTRCATAPTCARAAKTPRSAGETGDRRHRHRTTPPSTGPGWSRCSSAAPTSACTPLFVAPTVEALPAVCRSFLDVTNGLERARVGTVRIGVAYTSVRGRGRLATTTPRSSRKRLAPGGRRQHRRSTTPPTSRTPRSSCSPGRTGDRPRTRGRVIERWRQNNTILDRSGAVAAAAEAGAGTLRAIVGQGARTR